MIIRRFLFSISCGLLSLGLISANMHLQTTADPMTKDFELCYLDYKELINLDAPGVLIEKYADGSLRFLSFHIMNHHVQAFFHPKKWLDREQVALIKHFRIYDGKLLLDGPVYRFSEKGLLLSETHWAAGKLHGKQRLFNNDGQLVEEQHYERGFPIGCWSLYYDNGQAATTMTFPENAEGWIMTKTAARRSETKGKCLYSMPFYKAVNGTETWYDQNGIKQQEKHYKMRHINDKFVIQTKGYTSLITPMREI